MSQLTIVKGDDATVFATLKKDNQTFTIDPGATVQAVIANIATGTTAGPVTCLEGATGADWANSLVVVSLDSATTDAADEGASELEIQVNDSGKLTWKLTPVFVVDDYIP